MFLLGGDSGHGFKFLPVLGEEVVRILMREDTEARAKWKWPKEKGVWGGDGSRNEEREVVVDAEEAAAEGERRMDADP